MVDYKSDISLIFGMSIAIDYSIIHIMENPTQSMNLENNLKFVIYGAYSLLEGYKVAIKNITEKCIKMKDELDLLKSKDMIDHPPHYNSSAAKCTCGRRIECIDITRHMDFTLGNAMKYLWRWQDKGGLQDLKKAQWYLNDAIQELERKEAPQ